MSKQQKVNNERSLLITDHENESIFSVLGRGCTTLATAVVQLYLADAQNRQRWSKKCCGVVCFVKDNPKRSYYIRLYDVGSRNMVWEQEIYRHFKYKAPIDFFHTFEAHDCQAGLNFASEYEAAKFKRVVEGKLLEKHRKRHERRIKQQAGSPQPMPPTTGTIQISNGPMPASANVTLNQPPAVNTVNESSEGRHVIHVGWDPNTGLDMSRLDPVMKSLFEQIGIDDPSQVDKKTIDFIFDFIDKHGGLNAVREDLARRQLPAAPTQISHAPPKPLRVAPRSADAHRPEMDAPPPLPPRRLTGAAQLDMLPPSPTTPRRCGPPPLFQESDDNDDSGDGSEDDNDDSGDGIKDDNDDSGDGSEDDNDDSGDGSEDDNDDSGDGSEDDNDDSGDGSEDDNDDSGDGIKVDNDDRRHFIKDDNDDRRHFIKNDNDDELNVCCLTIFWLGCYIKF